MLTITERIPDFDTYEEYLGYRSDAALFFDIETTGLSPASSTVFLIGAVKKNGGSWQLTQWLAQRSEDEPLLLQAFLDAAADCDTLIHFNGNTFDLPFIMERARRLGLAGIPASGDSCGSNMHLSGRSMDGKSSLDLYQKFRPQKRLLGLSRMNQTTLEQFLGWPREDRLDGKQMISLFQKYVASQEPLLRDLLLLHNHDDVLGMTGLLRLSAYWMLFEGQFNAVRASIVYADSGNARSCMRLYLTLKAALPQDITLSFPCAFPGMAYTLTASGTQAILSIPGICGELRHFFPNWKDYYYLPLEDQAIHKSVGAFVDREYRVPATPADCCVKKSGLFFPQPEECFSPAFKLSYESKALFFSLPEDQEARPEGLAAHCAPQKAENCLRPEDSLALDPGQLASYASSLLRLFAHAS